jgi:hypothetical protein
MGVFWVKNTPLGVLVILIYWIILAFKTFSDENVVYIDFEFYCYF